MSHFLSDPSSAPAPADWGAAESRPPAHPEWPWEALPAAPGGRRANEAAQPHHAPAVHQRRRWELSQPQHVLPTDQGDVVLLRRPHTPGSPPPLAPLERVRSPRSSPPPPTPPPPPPPPPPPLRQSRLPLRPPAPRPPPSTAPPTSAQLSAGCGMGSSVGGGAVRGLFG